MIAFLNMAVLIVFLSVDVASDSKYLCVKLGISTDEVEDRPAIGSLIKSVLPTTNWIEYWMEHFFVIPTNRYHYSQLVVTVTVIVSIIRSSLRSGSIPRVIISLDTFRSVEQAEVLA